MREMTDGGSNIIVLFICDNKRNCTHQLYQTVTGLQTCFICLRSSGQNIVGVLQKDSLGILITDAFGSGHGMSADELCIKTKRMNMTVNVGFDAADIGQCCFRVQKRAQQDQVFIIDFHRSTQKDIIACGKRGINT